MEELVGAEVVLSNHNSTRDAKCLRVLSPNYSLLSNGRKVACGSRALRVGDVCIRFRNLWFWLWLCQTLYVRPKSIKRKASVVTCDCDVFLWWNLLLLSHFFIFFSKYFVDALFHHFHAPLLNYGMAKIKIWKFLKILII